MLFGRLGLRTSCHCLSIALSGNASKTDCAGVLVIATGAGAAGMACALLTGMVVAVLKLKRFDIASVLMKVDGMKCRGFSQSTIDGLNRQLAQINTPPIAQNRINKGFENPAYSLLRFLRPADLSGLATVAMRCTASGFKSV